MQTNAVIVCDHSAGLIWLLIVVVLATNTGSLI